MITIDVLKKSADTYTNLGEYYKINANECIEIENELEKHIFDSYPIEMTDELYDELYNLAKEKFSSNPFFLSVGSAVRGGKVSLPEPMGSMVECKEGEMEKWILPNIEYVISHKYDGCSCMVVYEDGNLKIAYSRGDGYKGQDITRHIKKFEHSLPKNIILEGKSFTGMIRGEIIVPKNDISKMIEELKEETKYSYKNGRNSVAGQLNSKDCAKSFVKYAHFIPYYISNFNGTEEEMFKLLENMGFEKASYKKVLSNHLTDENLIKEVKDVKENGVYECDGIIITQNVVQKGYEGYETSTLNPKRSRKFKIGATDNQADTYVEYIQWNISKDGVFIPRVKVKPVDIAGVTIDWVTGHNYKNIIDSHIGVGTKIKLVRRGEVIPHIEYVYEYPENIDYCLPNSELYVEDGVDIELCEPEYEDIYDEFVDYFSLQSIQKLVYFCSKLNVDFAGEGNIKKLIEETENYCLDAHNLLLLPKSIYQNCIGINGEKFYDSLHNKMKKTNVCEFMDAVGAFGRGIGELKLQKIYDKYNELPFDKQKVLDTDGWAETMTNQYMYHYASYINWLKFLREEYNFEFKKEYKVIDNTFKNVKVVFTGVRNKELEEIIKNGGGKVLSSCTKECNLLVAKDTNSTSSKIEKARKQGVEIISIDEAIKRFQ